MSETSYQACHRHFGRLKHETEVARNLLQRHGAPTPDTVKELRHETDMSMAECARMLRCMWRDMELEQLQARNTKLQKLVYDLLNAWDDMQHEVITGPTFDECERYAYELGIEVN